MQILMTVLGQIHKNPPYLPRAQHINFGRSHPPGKIIPRCPFEIPRNFPEFPGSAFFLALLYYLIGNPEFPGIFRHFPGEGFWGPRIAFSGGNMKLICWAAVNHTSSHKRPKHPKLSWISVVFSKECHQNSHEVSKFPVQCTKQRGIQIQNNCFGKL